MLNRRDLLNAARRIGTTLLVAPGVVAATSAAAAPGSAPPGGKSGISGRVYSILDGHPVAGATISISSLGLTATSDAAGEYALAAPSGHYLVHVAANGFVGSIRPDQTVREEYTSLNVDLVPFATSAAEQEAIYAKVVRQYESPLIAPALPPLMSLGNNFSLPTSITVYYDSWNPPQYVSVPLEDYVKGVIPNEVPPTWPMETLKAQAVASRSYGVASYLARGYVYPDTRSQMYNPNSRRSTTDAAVDATAGQVLSYAGAVITAFFFSTCNGSTTVNSENAIRMGTPDPNTGQYQCGTLGWNYVGYCRARPCTLHGPSAKSNCGYYGHGVGMCQVGSSAQGNGGNAYDRILASYYTSTTLENAGIQTPTPLGPFLVRAGQPFTLTWASAGAGASYNVSLQQIGGGSSVFAYNLQTTGWQVDNNLNAGTYTWTVTATLPNGQTATAQATLHCSNQIINVYLPAVAR